VPGLELAPPAEFGGPGHAWSPEHLLVASVQACFLFTLRAVARRWDLPFNAVEIDTTGTLDRVDGVTRFTEIVLRPRVTVPAGSDLDRVHRVLEKTKTGCLISASLATPVRMEPVVVEEREDTSAAVRAIA
jgi:peroxiredoxin-like protein